MLDGPLDVSRPARSPHAAEPQDRELDPAAIDNTEGPVIMASSEELAPRVTPGMTRKLAAILSADVAAYSRLMGEDEEATVRTVTAYRDVIATLVQQHHGRVVDSPGDNLLAEFASVVDAVQCAVAIQRELGLRNTALPLPRRMQFRLGVNLGDVIAEGDRIYGDGVNIAARLQGLAEAGGICVSGTVYDQVATKLPLTYKFLGRQAVKNIARPVRAYRVQAASGPSALKGRLRNRLGARPRPRMALAVVGLLLILAGGVVGWQLFRHPSWLTVVPVQQTAALALPNKPSIAVLPFVNMSGDREQEYFSDGMTEDLITDLASLTGLFVIARNSVFTYKGQAVKPERVRQELGVRYMLEGSVRKANDRVRITAQLIDTMTGYHLWAERYDRALQDIFAVQEEIARRITRALAVRLTPEEAENMGRPYTDSVEAWDAFKRGSLLYLLYKKEDNAQARELFLEAIDRDPQFARAYALLAGTHRWDWILAWTQDRDTSKAEASRHAQKAVELARQEPEPKPSLPYALQQSAYVLMSSRRYQEAQQAAEEAVQRNPNYADGYTALAQVLIYQEQTRYALDRMEIAKRLNPKYPPYYDFQVAQAYYVWGFLTARTDANTARQYYQQAEGYLRIALGRNNNYRTARTYLVPVLWELGRQDEAKAEMTILIQNQGRPRASQDPAWFQDYIRQTHPYENEAIIRRLSEIWQAAE
jgi:adenylate cyclase